MTRTRARIKEYWDNLFSSVIPSYPKFRRLETEIKEHFNWMSVIFKRVVFPLICFFALAGVIVDNHIFGSLSLSLLIFMYSNFLPDIDLFVKQAAAKDDASPWYEIYFLLFFAPLVAYYIIAGRATPLHAVKKRPFHSAEAVLAYFIFLFVVSSLFWPNESLKRLMLPTFGALGFISHLLIDGTFQWLVLKKKTRE